MSCQTCPPHNVCGDKLLLPPNNLDQKKRRSYIKNDWMHKTCAVGRGYFFLLQSSNLGNFVPKRKHTFPNCKSCCCFFMRVWKNSTNLRKMQVSVTVTWGGSAYQMWLVSPVLLFTVSDVLWIGLSVLTVEGSTRGNFLSGQAACFWNNA